MHFCPSDPPRLCHFQLSILESRLSFPSIFFPIYPSFPLRPLPVAQSLKYRPLLARLVPAFPLLTAGHRKKRWERRKEILIHSSSAPMLVPKRRHSGHGGCQLGHSIQPAGSLDRVAQFILSMDAPQQIPFHAILSAEAFTLPSLACASVGHSSEEQSIPLGHRAWPQFPLLLLSNAPLIHPFFWSVRRSEGKEIVGPYCQSVGFDYGCG